MPKLALFRQPKLRKKLLFTLMIVVLFRFGMELPVSGVNRAALGTALVFTGPLATLTGGALGRLAVFALGVYPFLLATVVVSFLVTAVPRLGTMAHDSVRGAQRIQQYTRVFAAAVAVLEATAVIAYAATIERGTARGQPVLAVHGLFPLATMVICMAAGAVVVMGLAEAISDNGLGRGVAILLATIASVLPKEFWEISKSKGFGVFTLALVVVLATVVFEDLLRRGAAAYPLRCRDDANYKAAISRDPEILFQLRVSQQETAIYDADGLLFLPVLATRLWPGITWLRVVEPHMREESDPWYLSAYILLIVIFTFVEAWIIDDPAKLVDRMKKNGVYIPDIRPGTPTRQYLSYVLDRLTVGRSCLLRHALP